MSCTKSKTFSRRNNFCFINFLIKALVSKIFYNLKKVFDKNILLQIMFLNMKQCIYKFTKAIYVVNANLQVSGHTVLDHFLTFVENTISY